MTLLNYQELYNAAPSIENGGIADVLIRQTGQACWEVDFNINFTRQGTYSACLSDQGAELEWVIEVNPSPTEPSLPESASGSNIFSLSSGSSWESLSKSGEFESLEDILVDMQQYGYGRMDFEMNDLAPSHHDTDSSMVSMFTTSSGMDEIDADSDVEQPSETSEPIKEEGDEPLITFGCGEPITGTNVGEIRQVSYRRVPLSPACLNTVNIRQMFPAIKLSMTALSRPTTIKSPTNSDIFTCITGTEDELHPSSNYLLFLRVDISNGQIRPITSVALQNVVRDVQVVSSSGFHTLLFTEKQRIGYLELTVSNDVHMPKSTVPEYFSSPDKEDLRALALATANNSTGDYLLSGGYDRVVKCYSVTEALRGAEPIETYSSHQFEVISSVQWRPGEIWEFSYTTDDGTFMLMDRRMRQPAKLVQGFQNSYSHTYISPNGVAVGTGQGMLAFFDLRASNRIVSVQHPYSKLIAEVQADRATNLLGVAGWGGISLWSIEANGLPALGYQMEWKEKNCRQEDFATLHLIPGALSAIFTTSSGHVNILGRFALLEVGQWPYPQEQ